MQTNIIVFAAPKITHPPHSPIMHRLGVGTTASRQRQRQRQLCAVSQSSGPLTLSYLVG
jgi:hypothetical protein